MDPGQGILVALFCFAVVIVILMGLCGLIKLFSLAIMGAERARAKKRANAGEGAK